jgi:hypothetical protein
MKKLFKSRHFRAKSGEMFIDVAILVLVSMMVIVLAINTFSFFVVKQDLDHYAKEMIKVSTTAGRTAGPEITNRRNELNTETGLNPTVAFDAVHFNNAARTVQFGDTITVTLTHHTRFQGFGIFSVPVTLTASHSGLSQRYFK